MTDIVTCHCGRQFFPSYSLQTECSAACRKTATKKPPKRRSNPGFEDPSRRCRVAGCTERKVHDHHVIYQQHLDDFGGDPRDSRNAFGSCELHHGRHHKAFQRFHVDDLRPENREFAVELLGEAGAQDYFDRYYDSVPR